MATHFRLIRRIRNTSRNRGRCWDDKRDYDKAIADYNEAIAIDPNNAYGFSIRAWSWMEKKEYDRAIADLSESFNINPKMADTLSFRAQCWVQKKEFDKAIEDNTEALKIDPRSTFAFVSRAVCWLRKGDFDKQRSLSEDCAGGIKRTALIIRTSIRRMQLISTKSHGYTPPVLSRSTETARRRLNSPRKRVSKIAGRTRVTLTLLRQPTPRPVISRRRLNGRPKPLSWHQTRRKPSSKAASTSINPASLIDKSRSRRAAPQETLQPSRRAAARARSASLMHFSCLPRFLSCSQSSTARKDCALSFRHRICRALSRRPGTAAPVHPPTRGPRQSADRRRRCSE